MSQLSILFITSRALNASLCRIITFKYLVHCLIMKFMSKTVTNNQLCWRYSKWRSLRHKFISQLSTQLLFHRVAPKIYAIDLLLFNRYRMHAQMHMKEKICNSFLVDEKWNQFLLFRTMRPRYPLEAWITIIPFFDL